LPAPKKVLFYLMFREPFNRQKRDCFHLKKCLHALILCRVFNRQKRDCFPP